MTIVEFVQARVDEREAGARKLLANARQTSLALQDPRLLGRRIPGWHDWPDVEALCESVLRDVEATRRIVELAEEEDIMDASVGELVLRAIAARWSDHADYDPSWSPA